MSATSPRLLASLVVSLVSVVGSCRQADTSSDGERAETGRAALGALTPKERLGQLLFEDPDLSEPPGQSCASCHDPRRAFSGNAGSSIDAVARGASPGAFGDRNVPAIPYAMFRPRFQFVTERDEEGNVETKPIGGFFWDGRADTLAEQAKGPFLNPREMNNPSPAAVVAKVSRAHYAELFRAVYGRRAFDDPGPAFEQIAEAIAAFERTPPFRRFSSKFDDYLRGKAALHPDEARGFALFQDPQKGNCLACHAGKPGSNDPADWLFTDFTFDALGLPRNQRIPDNADPRHFDLGLCAQSRTKERAPAGFDVDALCGAFQVPSLRNVELTAPYGHNGSLASLREVVWFYASRDTSPGLWYPRASGSVRKYDDLPARFHGNVNADEVPYDRKLGEKPRLSDDEIDAIVAFLRTLTDR